MNVTEIFPSGSAAEILEGRSSSEWKEILESVWYLLSSMADKNGDSYSDLDCYQLPRQRSCGICNQVNDTDENGQLPYWCFNPMCQEQRAFWGYNDDIRRPGRYCRVNGKTPDQRLCDKARSSWFAKHMKSTFGTSSLFDLPEDGRLTVLMSMTLERMALEQRSTDDKRIASTTHAGNGRPSSRDVDASTSTCGGNLGSTSEPLSYSIA